MANTYLLGTAPYQIPTNGDLGTMAFQDSTAISVGNANVSGNVAIGGTLSSANVTATVFTGNVTGNVTGTSSNATNLNSQPGSYYTNATNITTGTLPYAQLGANVVNTSANFTITGINTYQANLVIGNTTVNTQFSNSTILISNSTTTTTLGLGSINIGNTTTNVVIANTTSTFGGNVSITGSLSSANLSTTTNVVTIGTSAYYVANGNVGIGNTTPNATLQVQGDANVSGNAVIGGTILINNIITAYANSYTFSNSIAAANIDVFSSSTYRSAEYTLQLYDTTLATPAFEITKILIIHDNSNNTYMTEFGQIYNSQLLGTFTSGITAGNLYLQLTPTTANVVCKFIRNTFA